MDDYKIYIEEKNSFYISPQWLSNFIVDDFFCYLNATYSQQFPETLAIPNGFYQSAISDVESQKSQAFSKDAFMMSFTKILQM